MSYFGDLGDGLVSAFKTGIAVIVALFIACIGLSIGWAIDHFNRGDDITSEVVMVLPLNECEQHACQMYGSLQKCSIYREREDEVSKAIARECDHSEKRQCNQAMNSIRMVALSGGVCTNTSSDSTPTMRNPDQINSLINNAIKRESAKSNS
jgi:hypothetical protein